MPQTPEDRRPSPDALLEHARQAQRGKLKIFLGAAPGVGKTYEMLSAARRRLREGVDVVIGVVETHGRKETEALLDGLPLIPRKTVAYQGRDLSEMDLDALLERRPQLVLVDELAHSNAAGSRHAKRYLDVLELLDAGIDVYSTLNIQHVESLNDIVASITRVRVRETLPDSVLDRADDIEIIDLAPEDLIQRLREGRIYGGDGGERALQNYFTPGNLTALRELALRRTAERVDEQLRQLRRLHGVQEVWAAGERVLVCVDESAAALDLVRRAKRLADRFDAPWSALYLETQRSLHLSEAERDRVAATLRLAEQLGAEVLSLPGGHDIAADVLRYAREHNVTHLITGKSRRTRWFEWRNGSVVDRLVRNSAGISVHVIGEQDAARPTATAPFTQESFSWLAWLPVSGMVAAASGIGWLFNEITKVHNVALIFLSAVMLSALRYGLWPSLYAALASSLAYNYFFLEPRYNLTINDPSNVLSLFFFVAVSVVMSRLMAARRLQTLAMQTQATTTADLLAYSKQLAGVRKADELSALAHAQTRKLLALDSTLLLPDDSGKTLMARSGALVDQDLAAAQWCFERGEATGAGADTLPGARRLFLPLRAASGAVGVLGIGDGAGLKLSPPQRRLLDYIADLTAIAAERLRLARQVEQQRMLAETEQLRSALLTSISHDLRTPLASIMGAITSLRSYDALYDATQRGELLATAQDETERMHRFIGSLLDMTRLDAGALQPKTEACDLQEIIGAALQHSVRLLAQHRVTTTFSPDLPLIQLDFVLMEQVLVNLLENAAKYAPEGSLIEVHVRRHRYAVSIEISDEGSGIPAPDLQRIFDPFFRMQKGDRQRAGIGLGLTVCRGFMLAMGGRISARNRSDRSGTVFELDFPASLFATTPSL